MSKRERHILYYIADMSRQMSDLCRTTHPRVSQHLDMVVMLAGQAHRAEQAREHDEESRLVRKYAQ